MRLRRAQSVVLVLLLLTAAACATKRTQNNVLIPAMESAFAGIVMDANRGGASAASIDQYILALDRKDRETIVAMWPQMSEAAARGIAQREAAGEISAGVAAMLLERIAQFHEGVQDLRREMQ